MIFESSKRLKYDISKYTFKIIKYIDNQIVENYYIYLKGVLTTDKVKEFILAFREKFCYKPSNLNIFDSLDVEDIIDDYPLEDKDYIRYANTYIASIDFGSDDIIIEYPFKNSYYEELFTKI